MSIQIRESTSAAPVKSGNRWRVIVARPGKGSSGTYSEDLFRRDAAKLIPKGAQSFINHGERDPEKMIGVFPDGGYYDESEKAVVAELQVFEHWKAFVEEVAPYVGMSLYAMGEADEDGNVTEIYEDAYNGADLVARPGLAGSGIAEKLYEAAVSASEEKPSVTSAQEERKLVMEKDVEERFAALETLLTKLVAKDEAKAAEAAQVEADEAAKVEAVEAYDAAVKAIDEADLLPSQVAALRAEAKKGADVAPLIEAAKQVKADALASLQESADEAPAGRIVESASKTFKIGAWK